MSTLQEDMAGDIGTTSNTSNSGRRNWKKWLRDGAVFPQDAEPMLRIGKSYLGTKYVANTLDQGTEETLVIAPPNSRLPHLCRIYAGTGIGFFLLPITCKKDTLPGRHHRRLYFAASLYSDWIENGVRQGLLEDVTARNSCTTQLSLSYMSTHPKHIQHLADSPENVKRMAEYEKALSGKKVHWLPKNKLPGHGTPVDHGRRRDCYHHEASGTGYSSCRDS